LRYNIRVMKRPLKPRVLGDVSVKKTGEQGWSAFRELPSRVNLIEEKIIRIPFTKVLRVAIIVSAGAFLILGSVNAPTLLTKASGDDSTIVGVASSSVIDPTIERTTLESQLADLETQIDQYQGQISSYQIQGKTLNNQIAELNDKISSLTLQIQATNLTIEQLNEDISSTQSQITTIQASIANKKEAMETLLQVSYEDNNESMIQVFLQNPQLSDFWDETNAITLLQNNLRLTAQQITDLQSQLQNQEQEFIASKSDAAVATAYQASQVQTVATTKIQKTQLLTETQGQESKYQALLVQTQASAAQIRDRIFQLLGGGQLSFGDAYQYAQLASNATGMDPSFILAILDRESALGQNVGQCNYQTAMAPSQQPIFLGIVQSLNLNPSELLVSCPNVDGMYGGAMGPAQFEPTTWEIYAPQVQIITGDNPASPWKDSDAFVATALYLKDNMVGCQSAYTALVSQERCTAAKYYAGSRWSSYLWTYGEAVVERAESFAADIQTINSASSTQTSS
jgi:peptidoglycan hydrolase CwlO-like protein